MTKSEAQSRIETLFSILPMPDEHEVWGMIYEGAHSCVSENITLPELLDLMTSLATTPPDVEPTDAELIMGAVLGHIRARGNGGMRHDELTSATGYRSKTISSALRVLVKRGDLVTSGQRRGKRYSLPEVEEVAQP